MRSQRRAVDDQRVEVAVVVVVEQRGAVAVGVDDVVLGGPPQMLSSVRPACAATSTSRMVTSDAWGTRASGPRRIAGDRTQCSGSLAFISARVALRRAAGDGTAGCCPDSWPGAAASRQAGPSAASPSFIVSRRGCERQGLSISFVRMSQRSVYIAWERPYPFKTPAASAHRASAAAT